MKEFPQSQPRLALIALGTLTALVWSPLLLALGPSLDLRQYTHTAWPFREGFLNGTVSAFAQTPDGYLWLGTQSGVVRFDGVRAAPLALLPGQQLPSSAVSALLAGRDGTLWIGTLDGLASWKNGRLTHYRALAQYSVNALLQDRDGTVWAGAFGGPTGKLCAIRGENTACYGDDGKLGGGVASLYEDRDGSLWVGAVTGLWRWRPGPPTRYLATPIPSRLVFFAQGDHPSSVLVAINSIRQIVGQEVMNYPLHGVPSPLTASSLLRDRNGRLWIGTTAHGLVRAYQGKISLFTHSDGLSSDRVVALFEDREGTIWVATADGLDRFRESPVTSLSVKEGLSSATVTSVLAARDGSVWIGTVDGLNRWNDGQMKIYRTRSDPGLPDDAIDSLFEDERGRIWVSGFRGVAVFENGKFIAVPAVPAGSKHAIAGDNHGGLWLSLGLTSKGYGLVHLVEGRITEQVPWQTVGGGPGSGLVPDPDGGVWTGLISGGIAHFSGGQIRKLPLSNGAPGAPRVEELSRDRDGAMWAATEDGLSRITNGHVATLTAANGLPCNSVHWIIEDGLSSYWLYTRCGLLRIARTELDAWIADPKRMIKPTIFDSADGIRLVAIAKGTRPRATKSSDGKVWFVNGDTVSFVDPSHTGINTLPPPVHIEQITADGKTYDATRGLRLPPRVRNIVVDYTALSLVAPEKVHFRYRLEGQDPDWREVVNDRKVQYSNLAPSPYRFRVMACNNSGVWNETGDTLEFSIDPAYYQTNWFRLLAAATFLTMIWSIHHVRVRNLERRHREIRALNEALQSSEAYLAETQRLSHTGSWAFDLASDKYSYVSEECFRIFEMDAQEGLPSREAVSRHIHPEDWDRVRESFEGSLRERVETSTEFRIVLPSGTVKHIQATRHPVMNDAGEVVELVGSVIDMTERKRAEEELRAAESRFRTFVDHATDAFFLIGDHGRVLDVNRQACESLGYTREELIGITTREFDANADDVFLQWVGNRLDTEVDCTFETHHRRKDGTLFPVEVRAHPFRRGGRRLSLSLARDITERKRVEDALRLSNAYNRNLIEISLDPLVTIGPDGKVTDVNAATEAATGRSRSELIGTDFCDYFTEPAQARAGYEQAFREGLVRDYPLELRHRDGRVMSVLYNASVYRDESGQVSGVFAAARDITERKRAEEALRLSNAYNRNLIEISLDPLVTIGPDGKVTDVNAATEAATGRSRSELIGTDFCDYFTEPAQARAGYEQAFQEGLVRDYPLELRHRDGRVMSVLYNASVYRDEWGQGSGVFAAARDITERKRAEEALRESETRFRTFVDHAAEAFFMLDFEQGTIIDVNRPACESLGYTREELIGMNPMSFDVDLDRATLDSVAERAAAGETVLFNRHWHRRKDGSLFPVEVQTSVFWYGGRRFLLKVATDISDRLRAEEQRDRLRQLEADLAHINRVSMMGELAASVAHEVNQPLSGVVSNASAGLRWLAGDVPNLEEAREGLRRIVRDGKRAGQVIARIRALTRKAATPTEKLDLNETIGEVLALMGDEVRRKSVIIRTQFADDLSPVSGDRVQLQQVVLNLVMNAIEAMSAVDERARELAISTRNVDPDQVQVTVQDSGKGIDPQTIDRIFDSFYTTKPGGMGMGLSICRSILQAHGGRIWATANDGRGTNFHFTLPKHHEEGSNAEVAGS
jgi:PAS domain S-box-containing protein